MRPLQKQWSGFGDGGNGNLEARNTRGQLGALARRWVGGKPLEPLFIHAGEVVLVGEHDGDADDLLQ